MLHFFFCFGSCFVRFARVRNQLMEERKENVRAKEEKDLRELRER